MILLSTYKYNHSIHSVIDARPIDVSHNYPIDKLNTTRKRLLDAQEKTIKRFNDGKQIKTYNVGERVYLRRNKRLGNNFDKIFIEKVVERDLGTTVMIEGKKVHKSNLR